MPRMTGEKAVKNLSSILFLYLFSPMAYAQDQGTIECLNRTSISAWEKPGSLFVVKQLPCGQTVTILGTERGYLKILINQNVVGYLDPQYIKLLQSQRHEVARSEDKEKKFQQPMPVAPQSEPKTAISTPSHTNSAPERIRRHQSLFGIEISRIRYAESSISVQEKEIMGGIASSYSFHPKKLMFGLDSRYSWGATDYASPSGQFNNLSNYSFETRFVLGRDIKSGKTLMTPFVGFGHRFRHDDLSLASSSYTRLSHYLYSPIGMASTWSLGNGWSLGAAGEFDFLWHGRQDNRISDSKSGMNTLINEQKKGWGARGSARIMNRIGAIDFVLEPFLRHWKIDNPNVANLPYYDNSIIRTVGVTPNSFIEWGIRLGFGFSR
jgi:hypothetical protein